MPGKRLLAGALERPLPEATVHHPKQGFTLPFARWMNGDLAPFVRDGMRQLSDAAGSRRGARSRLGQLAAGCLTLEPAAGASPCSGISCTSDRLPTSRRSNTASVRRGDGRDRWEVRIVNAWIRATVPPLLASAAPGPVIDAGCGEQPFPALIEAHARQYVGMDAVQNGRGSVAVLSDLESVPAAGPRYPVVLCTEVLEHVADINESFAGLREADRSRRLRGADRAVHLPGAHGALRLPAADRVRHRATRGVHGSTSCRWSASAGRADSLATLLEDASDCTRRLRASTRTAPRPG